MSTDIRIEKVSNSVWTVWRGDLHVGDVLGGGPTKATRYKAIHHGDAAVDSAAAPAHAYAPSLEKAADALAELPGRQVFF